jgi:hypothetical protein
VFNSYLELSLGLESYQKHGHCIHSYIDKSLNKKIKYIKSNINSNYPVYEYISNLIPSDSIFLVRDQSKVLGYNYIYINDLDFDLKLYLIKAMKTVYSFPSSFLYKIKPKNKKLQIQCINPGFESCKKINSSKFIPNAISDSGVIPIENTFKNPFLRNKRNSGYKSLCDTFIVDYFS